MRFSSSATVAYTTVQFFGTTSNNTYGQLGDGTTTQRLTPVAVSGITTAVEMAAGSNHTCARLSDNTLQCWGNNEYGQLGDGTTINHSTPVTVLP